MKNCDAAFHNGSTQRRNHKRSDLEIRKTSFVEQPRAVTIYKNKHAGLLLVSRIQHFGFLFFLKKA